MRDISEQEFILKHNRVYGEMIREERRRRNLSLEELSSGILSRTALEKVEKGKAQWTKLTGDTLMLRMGISPEYFESLSSGEDLDRWKMREDICLLVPGDSEQALAKLEEYRETYGRREPLEEQFLLKAEVVLMLSHAEGESEGKGHHGRERWFRAGDILEKAKQAVECTVRSGWEQSLADLCLSPGELEAVLLVGVALFVNGREEEAWTLWQAVWEYPKAHSWEERTMMLILPQAAAAGIRQAYAFGSFADILTLSGLSEREMAARGWEALELLRRNGAHCYVLPLLDALCSIKEDLFRETENSELLRQFREVFREVYEWFNYSGYRMWQGISVDNTRDAGNTLKMLRTFYGKSRENAVYDGGEVVVTPRQLEKIEKGIHKPSYENYRRLARQYGKLGEWNMPLLETDSADVLALRQKIATLMEYADWERAEWQIGRFRKMVNPAYPKVRQELLLFDAILKQKKGEDLRECLKILMEALRCTVPDFEDRDPKWWVYQREEIMIASNIGGFHRRLGNFDEAKKWLEGVLFYIKQNSLRTGIYLYGHDVVFACYDNYLGDTHCLDNTVEMGKDIILKLLLLSRISGIQKLFYHIAWNAYEIAAEKPERKMYFQQIWEKAFRVSEIMAEFMADSSTKVFLSQRRTKYL